MSQDANDAPTVHVVDDDESFLSAVSRLLRACGFVVRTFASAGEFLEECRDIESGCVVVDLRMPGLDGLELQSSLSRARCPLPVIFLTGHADTVSTVRAMRAGAEDFLEKCADKEALLAAIRHALEHNEKDRGDLLVRSELRARFDALSVREREVLAQVVQGRLNKQIAGELGIHERTVKLHRRSIMMKLNVRSVAALVQLSRQATEATDAGRTFPFGQ